MLQCEDLTEALAATSEGNAHLGRNERRHVERCLRCQAEIVQYRKLLRVMRTMRTDVLEHGAGPVGRHPRQPRGVGRAARHPLDPLRAPHRLPRRPRRRDRRRCGRRHRLRLPHPPHPPGRLTQHRHPAAVRWFADEGDRSLSWDIGHGIGCRSSPPRAVAQLAEQRSPKPQVGGSSPSCPALFLFLNSIRGSRHGDEPTAEAHDAEAGPARCRWHPRGPQASCPPGAPAEQGRAHRARAVPPRGAGELRKVAATRPEVINYRSIVLSRWSCDRLHRVPST